MTRVSAWDVTPIKCPGYEENFGVEVTESVVTHSCLNYSQDGLVIKLRSHLQ